MVTTPKKVLIIDDSNTECLFMRQALQSAGYQVLIANDGTQGLRMLPQERPQCLVLDIVLPGISGFEVCRQLRSQDLWRDLPIVIVSTKNSSSDRFWALKQGANQYLPKPFKGDMLVKVVAEVLAEHQERTNSASSSPPQPSSMTERPATGPATRQQPAANPLPRWQSQATGPNPGQPPSSSGPFKPGVQDNGRLNGTMPTQRPAANETNAQGPRDFMSETGASPLNPVSGSWPAISHDARPQQEARPQSPNPMSSAQNLFLKLIPRRSERAEMLWANGPDSLFITDRAARQLYLAIDGKTNVEMLCRQIGLSKEEMFKALRVLVSQQRIQLVDPQGRPFDSFFLQ
jgi:CheY-like chemotaxis protein